MFEHMAFKGTDKIGTTNYAAEKPALEKVEIAYAAYIAERDKRVGRDEAKLKQLEKAWKDAIAEADKYVVPNQFGKIIEQSGGQDLNAFTDYDETAYHYSLPANRLELWAYLESERFLHPVLREFYKERNVVIEERRLRTDSNPIGRLLEQFNAAAFEAHPYHRPTVGWMSDLNSFSATDAKKFFNEYYVPANMVVAVAGDVKASQVMPILEKYFGRLPASHKPDETTTTEPPQNSERKVVLKEKSQPLYLEGYHRPDYMAKDDAVYDAITDLMSEGRTSRLYRALVRDKKIASFSAGFSGLPGTKYPHLFAFYAFPLPGHTHAGSGRRDSRRNRTPQEGRHQRRRIEDDQDPHQSQPDPRPRRQRGTGNPAGDLPDSLRRLARVVPIRRPHRQSDQGRHSARGQRNLQRYQPHRRRDRNGHRRGPRDEQGSGDQGASDQAVQIDSSRSGFMRTKVRRIREVRNETNANCLFSIILVAAAITSRFASQSRGTGNELAADPHPASARVPSAAAEAHRTLERHGDLPAGGSRTAAD